MAANNFFAYSQSAPAGAYSAAVASAAYPSAAVAAAAGVAVTPSVAVAAQPPQVQAANVANVAPQFVGVAQSQPTAPPSQPPPAATFRPVIAYQQSATYVMAPPTAAATPVVTSVYPTSTYHPYPPPAAPVVAAAAGPVQVYDANTKTSYYAQPPVSSVAPVTYALGEAHYQARPTYSASSIPCPPMSRPQQNVMRVSYTYGQPSAVIPTTSYSYPGAAAVAAASPLKTNLYALPASSVASAAPGSWTRVPQQAPVRPLKPPKPPPKPQQLHYCDVCKISCAGPQTYKEHLDGQKHKKKAAGLLTPSANGTNNLQSSMAKVGLNALRCELCDVTCTGSDAYAAHIRGAKHQKVIKLHTRLGKPIPSVDPVIVKAENKKNKPNDKCNNPAQQIPILPEEKVIQPVGFDYIEEVKNGDGKLLSFTCKLCDCKFNDPNAKEMHMKGRRHRLQYKKKVNPDLVVDLKPSLRQRRLAEERAKRSLTKEDFWRRREEECRIMDEEEKNMLSWGSMPTTNLGTLPMLPAAMMIRRPDSSDDKHVIAKHGQIYPTDEQLASIQKLVSNVEKSLKNVSDNLEGDLKLKGVMRVGALAKGLLLKSDSQVELVLLASEVPTRKLLETVAHRLQSQLSNKSDLEGVITVSAIHNEGLIEVKVKSSPVSVRIGLTSASVRSSSEDAKLDKDCLAKDKCLAYLASLRHAKWFGARAAGLQSAVIVLRVLRDLQSCTPCWQPLKPFALELIVEKALASTGLPLSPGDALRRVLEAIAGGCLLNGCPGLLDPCEKEPTDALANLSNQEREALTSHAQRSLRLLAFRQIHLVLNMAQLSSFSSSSMGKKRPSEAVSNGASAAKIAKEK